MDPRSYVFKDYNKINNLLQCIRNLSECQIEFLLLYFSEKCSDQLKV